MDVHRVSNHNVMDYNFDNMEPKHGKMLPCQEDRFDSGLDSLKEDELVSEIEEMTLNISEELTQEYEPWRSAVTEDGDTLLHLAIIHEATDHAFQMIKLSHNHPFLNVQNHQRQTALHLAVITEQPQLVERLLKAGCDPRLADDSGNTALHIACKRGSLACFGVITQNSQQHITSMVSFPNYSGHNCLHLASINGYISLVESLVRLGADINAQVGAVQRPDVTPSGRRPPEPHAGASPLRTWRRRQLLELRRLHAVPPHLRAPERRDPLPAVREDCAGAAGAARQRIRRERHGGPGLIGRRTVRRHKVRKVNRSVHSDWCE